MASMMRWRAKDKEELRKAVVNYNNKIKRLEAKGYKYLPEKIDYKTLLKGSPRKLDDFGNVVSERVFPILSRREYNNQINALKRWTQRNAEELVTLPSGQQTTRYQKQEAIYKQIRATRSLNKAIALTYKEARSKDSTVRSKAKSKRKMLTGVKEHISKVNASSGYERTRILDLLEHSASADRELKKATVWFENFMNAIDSMEYDNKEILINKLKSFSNPISAYEYISQVENLVDLFDYYKDKATSSTYGGFDSNQQAFDNALLKLGLL